MTTFELALSEYENEDDNGQSKLIYTYFGLAVYKAQCLEETFSFILWSSRIIENNIMTNEEVNEIIDSIENSKKTMGSFIYEIKKAYNLSIKVEKELFRVLENRNYLIHKYFKLEISKFYSDNGKKSMLKFFSTFVDDVTKLDDELKFYTEKYRQKFGLKDKYIYQLMEEMKYIEKNKKYDDL